MHHWVEIRTATSALLFSGLVLLVGMGCGDDDGGASAGNLMAGCEADCCGETDVASCVTTCKAIAEGVGCVDEYAAIGACAGDLACGNISAGCGTQIAAARNCIASSVGVDGGS